MTPKIETAYKKYNTEEAIKARQTDSSVFKFESSNQQTAQKTFIWFARTLENKSLSSVVFQTSLPLCILRSIS